MADFVFENLWIKPHLNDCAAIEGAQAAYIYSGL